MNLNTINNILAYHANKFSSNITQVHSRTLNVNFYHFQGEREPLVAEPLVFLFIWRKERKWRIATKASKPPSLPFKLRRISNAESLHHLGKLFVRILQSQIVRRSSSKQLRGIVDQCTHELRRESVNGLVIVSSRDLWGGEGRVCTWEEESDGIFEKLLGLELNAFIYFVVSASWLSCCSCMHLFGSLWNVPDISSSSSICSGWCCCFCLWVCQKFL